MALGGLPAILLIVPMIHKIFFAFAAASTLIVSILRWWLPSFMGATALGLLIIAIVLSAPA